MAAELRRYGPIFVALAWPGIAALHVGETESNAPAQPAATAKAQSAPGCGEACASASDVAWLAGRWVGEGFGGATETMYAPPTNGRMVGTFRLDKNGTPSFFEFLLIEENAGSLIYRVKHFHRNLTAWEEKDKHVSFPLVRVERNKAVFDGLTFELQSPDDLVATVVVAKRGQVPQPTVLRFRRARDSTRENHAHSPLNRLRPSRHNGRWSACDDESRYQRAHLDQR